MFTTFLNEGRIFAGHWAVVIGVSLVFLIVQIVLCLRVYLRLRRQNRSLAQLSWNLKQGSDWRADECRLPGHFGWLRWVYSLFAPVEPVSPSNITRDDVLRELDVRIAGDSSYLLLQRMGVMAPLLGVVLTVVSFFWLEIDGAQSQSLPSILLALTPLVSGVGAGAVLALINQALLHVVGRRIELLRLSARDWFDAAIWSKLPLETAAAKSSAVAAVERYSRSMAEAADRYAGGAKHIETCTASITDAARQFHEIVQSFGAEIKGMPAVLHDVRNATTASAKALRDLIPVNSRAVASLDVSVSAFRTTIDREFAAAAKLHQRSSKDLSDAIEQIGAVAERLKRASTELTQTAESNAGFFERMKASLEPYLAEPNRQLHEVADNLTAQIKDVSAAAASLTQNANAIASEFASVTGVLAPAISSLGDAIDTSFQPTLAKQQKQIVSVGRSVQRLRGAAEGLAEGTANLNAMLSECSLFLDEARSSREALASATASLTDVTRQLHGALDKAAASLPPTAQAAADSASRQATISELETAFESLETVEDVSDGTGTTKANSTDERSGRRTWVSPRPR